MEKMQNYVKLGYEWATWLTFRILRPPAYLGKVEARNFKLGMLIDSEGSNEKNAKIGQRRVTKVSRDEKMQN